MAETNGNHCYDETSPGSSPTSMMMSLVRHREDGDGGPVGGGNHGHDAGSVDSNYDDEAPTILQSNSLEDIEVGYHHSPDRCQDQNNAIGNKKRLVETSMTNITVDSLRNNTGTTLNINNDSAIVNADTARCASATLEFVKYDAKTIRSEFKTYQKVLPNPDTLLQEQHSFQILRNIIEENNLPVPRFLRYKFEGGIKPHHALCCLLLTEYQQEILSMETKGDDEKIDDEMIDEENQKKEKHPQKNKKQKRNNNCFTYWLARVISFGRLYPQFNNPAEVIRDQFYRVAEVVPLDVVKPHELRKKIRNRGLPIPNYFLDPESDKQFPPHIALLVILQDGEKESEKFGSILYRVTFSLFALMALLLRVVLEVVGGAGAIWGGGEVLTIRNSGNNEVWRWLSIAVGILCLFRFVTLNIPHKEDDGDILGPAGPWSLRTPLRIRAVGNHPFHYFFRAVPPCYYHDHHLQGSDATGKKDH